jgi:hypothetical protein
MLGRTFGTPISGDPPMIDVRPSIPGVKSISVPICDLTPEPPWGEHEHCAFVVAGELQGQKVVVSKKTGEVWDVQVSTDSSKGVVHRISPDILVTCWKLQDE